MAATTNPNALIGSIIILVALTLGIAWYVNTHPKSVSTDTSATASSTSTGTLQGTVR